MKTLKPIIGTIIAIAFVAYFFMKTPAAKYNDRIVGQYDHIEEKFTAFIAAIEKGENAGTLEIRFRDFSEQVKDSLKAVREMPDFKGNTELRDKGVELFELHYSMLEYEYRELLEIFKPTELTTYDVNRLHDLIADIEEKEENLLEEFNEVQQKFAKEYGLKLK